MSQEQDMIQITIGIGKINKIGISIGMNPRWVIRTCINKNPQGLIGICKAYLFNISQGCRLQSSLLAKMSDM